MTHKLVRWMNRGGSRVLGLAPYVAAATLLPGGSVVLALVWLYRHRSSQAGSSAERRP